MQNYYSKLHEMIESHQVGASGLVVVGDPEMLPAGTKFIVGETGELLAGNISKDVINVIKENLLKSIQSKNPKNLTLSRTDSVFFPSSLSVPFSLTSDLTIFIDPIYPQTHLIILGGGHIALPLVKLGKFMNFQVTVADDRPSFANSKRFAEADNVICDNFEKVFQRLSIDSNTFVVIVTRGHRYDQLCLEEALNSAVKPAYIGMIGSRRKVTTIMNTLQENGIPEEVLDSIYAPIGLDIGAQTPEEIALSILAEMVMIKRYGYSNGLKTQARGKKINGQ